MSNPYCSITQLGAFCDIRQVGELSNDTNADAANNTNLQLLLDAQAGELESALAGRYPLPLPTVPAVLTKWVAVTTVPAI